MRREHGHMPRLGGTLLLTLWLVSSSLAEPGSTELERRWERFLQSPAEPVAGAAFPHADCFERAAERHGIPQALLLAVARGESNFDPLAVSAADAYGLMQIRWPTTAQHLGITRKSALFEPCTNVDAGARYLAELLARYGNNLHRALSAYNYGPGRIPQHGGVIPQGAVWYSGYIYRHLDYIRQAGATARPLPEGAAGEIHVIHFRRPYRADALVRYLQPRLGAIRLDWFERPRGGYDVVLLYQDTVQRESGLRILEQEGLTQGVGLSREDRL